VVPGEIVQGDIKLEYIDFIYPTRPGFRVLRNLSLTVEPEIYVPLLGPSCCGKSTVSLVGLAYSNW